MRHLFDAFVAGDAKENEEHAKAIMAGTLQKSIEISRDLKKDTE